METYDIIASMESKKDLTKELIANCFHELMLTTPFDKITIKMITGEAGLIRPTFYKHFQDKWNPTPSSCSAAASTRTGSFTGVPA